MKKILTYILLFSALSVGCIFPTMGAFAMSSIQEQMNQNMSQEMTGNMKMPCHSKNDSTTMHECCDSPFSESFTQYGNISQSDQNDTDNSDTSPDGKVLFGSHEHLRENCLHRLNAPPGHSAGIYDIPNNIYIALIGIIKNNN